MGVERYTFNEILRMPGLRGLDIHKTLSLLLRSKETRKKC
jgi:hypothetical protein